MFLRIEENPNCEIVERVFQERSSPTRVNQVLRQRQGQEMWCSIEGVENESATIPALARKVDDSGEGTCYLGTGGAWGLRLSDGTSQWAESFLLLPGDGADLRLEAGA